MKVTNLTDMETKALKQRQLHQQHIAIGSKMLAPGASEDIDNATMTRVRPMLQDMVSKGLLAVGDTLPADYVVAKAQVAPPVVPDLKPALVKLPEPAPASEAVTEPAPADPSTTSGDEPSARTSRSTRGGR